MTQIDRWIPVSIKTEEVSNLDLTQGVAPNPETTMATGAVPVLYPSLESVLEVFNRDQYKDSPGVQKCLEAYERTRKDCGDFADGKRYPLIVIEGLDGSGKTTLTKKLSTRINGTLYYTPPEALAKEIRPLFENDPVLRTAFYALGNYIGALEMRDLMRTGPVVLDRFWHSTAAYALSSVKTSPETARLPARGDPIYAWPSDLLKPDMVLLLDVTEPVRMRRLSRRKIITAQEELLKNNHVFRNNVRTAYSNMTDPEVVFVNADGNVNVVLRDLLDRTKHLF